MCLMSCTVIRRTAALLHRVSKRRLKLLGSAYHASHINTQRKASGHIRQLEALGYTVTLTQAA